MTNQHKIFQTLEFEKILTSLASHAETSLGKQLAHSLQPASDFEEVKLRLKLTDEALKVIRFHGGASFGGIRDVTKSIHRAKIAGLLQAGELLQIAETLYGARRLKRMLLQVHEEHAVPGIAEMCRQITEHRSEEQAIKACIDDEGSVVDHASGELARIRQEMRTNVARIREKLETMIRSSSTQKMLQEQLITMRGDRYVIPVKQEYRASFGGMIHDQSASGATLFIEPQAVVNLNNRLRELKLKEEKEIEKILRGLTEQVASIADEVLVMLDWLAQLDFVFAKGALASQMKATLPKMNDRGYLKLIRARHPLIEGDQVVPTNVELGNSYTAIIITGPNTGGKTVTLKTIGLLSLMAMAGLFIPAEDGSQLCMFDAIYADIGDEQSIEQSLSTFSSHMTNIIAMLREMTPKSLVLLDELGAGTDPAEGSALAIAILEAMHKRGCRIVATTHYSELKAYAYQRKGVINASMEFDIQTLSPTYRLLIGVPGRSNAFAIAEKLGLPKPILDRARGEIGEEEQKVESMIASLEANRIGAEEEHATAQQLRKEVERLRSELEEQKRRFDEKKNKLLAKAEQEAREAVEKARKEANMIITELRKLAMEERASVKEHKLIEARRKLDEAVPELRKKSENKQSHPSSGKNNVIEPGDEVHVISLQQKGHVIECVGEREAMVQIGIMKMKLPFDDLQRIQTTQRKNTKAGTAVKRQKSEEVKLELDLRGSNLEEALIEVDRFLDDALMSNLNQVYIIHGKGTGVLRNGIQEYLRRHKRIKQYRLGNYGEGGAGVTVAELK